MSAVWTSGGAPGGADRAGADGRSGNSTAGAGGLDPNKEWGRTTLGDGAMTALGHLHARRAAVSESAHLRRASAIGNLARFGLAPLLTSLYVRQRSIFAVQRPAPRARCSRQSGSTSLGRAPRRSGLNIDKPARRIFSRAVRLVGMELVDSRTSCSSVVLRSQTARCGSRARTS
jgi:hypothetical protein